MTDTTDVTQADYETLAELLVHCISGTDYEVNDKRTLKLLAEHRLAHAPPVVADEGLVRQAREICARVMEGHRGEYFQSQAEVYREGTHDDEPEFAYVLAALTRPAIEAEVRADERAKLRAVISHATGGSFADPDASLNEISCRITAFRNTLWRDAQAAAIRSPSSGEADGGVG